MKFKIGDRVEMTFDGGAPLGAQGTIIYIDFDARLLVEYDNPLPAGHDGDGRGKPGHCRWTYADWAKVLPVPSITSLDLDTLIALLKAPL